MLSLVHPLAAGRRFTLACPVVIIVRSGRPVRPRNNQPLVQLTQYPLRRLPSD